MSRYDDCIARSTEADSPRIDLAEECDSNRRVAEVEQHAESQPCHAAPIGSARRTLHDERYGDDDCRQEVPGDSKAGKEGCGDEEWADVADGAAEGLLLPPIPARDNRRKIKAEVVDDEGARRNCKDGGNLSRGKGVAIESVVEFDNGDARTLP